MQVRGRDSVAAMYVKRMATVHKRAKDDLVEQQLQQQERVERLVTQYEGVLGVLTRETTDTRTGREVRALFGSHREIESARSECLTVKSWTGSNYLPLLWDHHKHHRSVLFEPLGALKLESATEDSALLDALASVREHQHGRADWIQRRPDFSRCRSHDYSRAAQTVGRISDRIRDSTRCQTTGSDSISM
jgi:hypothetical protein